jgi:hypothetical protein
MKCRTAVSRLSLYLDGRLEQQEADRVAGHISSCESCRGECERLRGVIDSLRGLPPVEAPPYLRHMVDRSIAAAAEAGWLAVLRNCLEYRWSRIRTTETSWYLIRALGTAVTFVFFFFISEAVGPEYFKISATGAHRGGLDPNYTYHVGQGVLRKLGYLQFDANNGTRNRVEPGINDLYLLNFGQSVSKKAPDDSFSVVTEVDRNGSARIRTVIEYPADSELLSDFNYMLQSARCRPASHNGRVVDSKMVLTFSQISVYD